MIMPALATRLGGAGLTAVLAAAVLAPSLSVTAAQAATAPPGREWPSFSYYPTQNDFVMFGGHNATTTFGDTWTRTGKTWTQQHPATSPPARVGAPMVYDPKADPISDFPILRSLAPVLAAYNGAAELERGLDILLTGLTKGPATTPPRPSRPAGNAAAASRQP